VWGNHVTNFAFTGTTVLSIEWLAGTINSCQINPLSLGLACVYSGTRINITLAFHAKFELQINTVATPLTQMNQLLYVFADAPEDPSSVPAANDPTVYYYGPGNWTAPGSVLTITQGDSHRGLYLAPGARLNAALVVSTTAPFVIWGRGSIFNPFTNANHSYSALHLTQAQNFAMQSVSMFNSYRFVQIASAAGVNTNLSFTDVRMLAPAHALTAGFTLAGAFNGVTIDGLFLVNGDDQVQMGNGGGNANAAAQNMLITRSTFIKQDSGGNWLNLQGGTATVIGPNIVASNNDIVRMVGTTGLIYGLCAYPEAIYGIVVDNTRVQDLGTINAGNPSSVVYWNFTTSVVANITLSNMNLPIAAPSILIGGGNLELILINVSFAGELVTSVAQLNVTMVCPSQIVIYATATSNPVIVPCPLTSAWLTFSITPAQAACSEPINPFSLQSSSSSTSLVGSFLPIATVSFWSSSSSPSLYVSLNYTQQLVADGALLVYEMNDTEGSSVADISGNGNTGTYNNYQTMTFAVPQSLFGTTGTDVAFPGLLSAYVSSPTLTLSQTTSWEIWISTCAAIVNETELMHFATSNATLKYSMVVGPSNTPRCGSINSQGTNVAIVTGTPQHIGSGGLDSRVSVYSYSPAGESTLYLSQCHFVEHLYVPILLVIVWVVVPSVLFVFSFFLPTLLFVEQQQR
jgi:hypothetical protein